MTDSFSCVVSSVTRLSYTVLFDEADIEGNYAVNFDCTSLHYLFSKIYERESLIGMQPT